MIKRIIFDIDNTLIDFPDYIDGYQSVLDKYHVNKKAIDLYNAIGVYEECGKYQLYNKEELLSKKYELVTLSNWFTFSQKSRLKIAGIDKYFSNIYGTDIVPMKPKKEAFISVIGDKKIEECLMVGDNIAMDIEVPYKMGMNVYYLSKGKDSIYQSIEKIEDLKEML